MERRSGRMSLLGQGWRRLTLVLAVPIWLGGLVWMQDRWPSPPRRPDALAGCSRYFPENVSSIQGSCEATASWRLEQTPLLDAEGNLLSAEQRANADERREIARRQAIIDCEASRARLEARMQADFAACSAVARSPERVAQRDRDYGARLLSYGLKLVISILPILLAPLAFVLMLFAALRAGQWVRQGFAAQPENAAEQPPTDVPPSSREGEAVTAQKAATRPWRDAVLALSAIGGGAALIVVLSLATGATPTQAGQYAGAYIAGWVVFGLHRLWTWAWAPLPKLNSRASREDVHD